MKITKQNASDIAKLLNDRNELAVKYTAGSVLKSKENYVFQLEKGKIVACAESKKVQWYQWEISHVSVSKEYEGKGYGSEILKLAEEKAMKGGARILQCTIRTSNERSIKLFSGKGYRRATSFFYPVTGNWVFVYQKCISI